MQLLAWIFSAAAHQLANGGRRLRFLLTLTLQYWIAVQQSSTLLLSAVTPTNPANFVSDKSLKNQIFDKDIFSFFFRVFVPKEQKPNSISTKSLQSF